MAKSTHRPVRTARNVRPPGGGEVSAPAPPPTASPPTKRGRRLRTVANVRAALASLYRQVERSDLELGRKAKLLSYMSSILLTAIQGADLEARVAALEARGIR